MKKPKAIGITRGYARSIHDEKRLRATGITKPIYRADNGETLGKFRMRSGEALGVVDGFRAFGEAKRDMLEALKLMRSWSAIIVDAETGLRSDQDGAEMMAAALGPNRPRSDFLEMQAKSVKERVKGRMDKRTALTIWRNPKLSVSEAIELMTKWTQATAYKQLGKRDVPAGRRKKP